ncbi:MAG: glycine dehydrogenase (aminomethyl-transferring), partial [Micrococcales bacterium]
MLSMVGDTAGLNLSTTDDLIAAAVPAGIRDTGDLDIPPAQTEPDVLARLRALADRIRVRRSMLGQGYYDTAYTPYQPEISQGRLEALLNFQTMVADLTGLDTANSSLLDEATAAAEAMSMMRRQNRKAPKDAVFLVDTAVFPQTRKVLATRAGSAGQRLVELDLSTGAPALTAALTEHSAYGILLQYPCADGLVRDDADLVAAAKEQGLLVAVAADLLALTLLRPPGQIGADVAVGTSQRFGVPMGFGGPHAGYMAVRAGFERALPGRLVGVSKDVDGKNAYRLALQTREQHIRRDKATSNICTAQVLLAVLAAMYAVYHGPGGLRRIATRVHHHALDLAGRLEGAGLRVVHENVFDTLLVRAPGRAGELVAAAADAGYLLRHVDADHIGISCDETTTADDVAAVAAALGAQDTGAAGQQRQDHHDPDTGEQVLGTVPAALRRTSPYLTHPVFNSHHSETQMLRYLKSLCDKDFALDRGMIPLGSCTMKLTATTEMI